MHPRSRMLLPFLAARLPPRSLSMRTARFSVPGPLKRDKRRYRMPLHRRRTRSANGAAQTALG
jgi:hypothetical protein